MATRKAPQFHWAVYPYFPGLASKQRACVYGRNLPEAQRRADEERATVVRIAKKKCPICKGKN